MRVLKEQFTFLWALLSLCAATDFAAAQFAADVVSYAPGATPAPGFTTSAAALGSPERFTGEGVFPGVVSPFSPPFLPSEIVSVGEGGHLTLRLSHYALPQPGAPEIGVFENVGLIISPGGEAVGAFGPDTALVEVSENGTSWVSLGDVTFDIPANGYTDLTDPFSSVPGTALSDFQQPFTGVLSDFFGKPYAGAPGSDVLSVLAGSGGGTWLDISGTGLARVGFIRFSLADDGNPALLSNFEIDGVSILHAALGDRTIPEPAAITLLALAVATTVHARIRLSRVHRSSLSSL